MKSISVKSRGVADCGYRFDASYHLSDGVSIKRAIANASYGSLCVSDVTEKIFYGIRANRTYVKSKEHAIPFMTGANIMLSDLSNTKLVSKKYTPCVEEMTLHKGWVLITRSGTVGQTAYSNKLFEGKYGSEDIIRVIPNDKIKGGILYAFLASKYGNTLLTQGSFGAVIQHIEPSFVGSISIPNFPESFQTKIDDLIQESARLREEATEALEEAVSYFDKLYPIEPNVKKCFAKSIHDLGFSFASYNNNVEVDAFIDSYSDHSIKLSDITSKIFAPPLFKHIYLNTDNGYPFMTGSELTKFNMRYYRWLSPRGVKDINDYVVKKGTLLLYKSGTTDGGILGNVFIADKKLDGCCLSDHVIRIVFNDEKMAYWAFAFLKSKGAVRLLQRLATGTMIPFITPERIADTFIPAPDENYDKITSLIEKYIDLNSQSKYSENKAIDLVEQEIERWNQQ